MAGNSSSSSGGGGGGSRGKKRVNFANDIDDYDRNDDLENQSLLVHTVNGEVIDGNTIGKSTRERSTIMLIRIFTVTTLLAFLLSTNILFFIGGRVVFMPPALNTTSTSGGSSLNVTATVEQFNFQYFYYFSSFDILLLCYISCIFWVVILVTDGFIYYMVTYSLTIMSAIYLMVKLAIVAPILSKQSIDPSILPVNSPLALDPTKKELALILVALSLGMTIIFLVLNIYPLAISYYKHKQLKLVEKEKLEKAEREESSINKTKKATRVKNSNAKRLVTLSKPELPYILAAMVALIISSISTLAIPAFFGQIVEVVSTSKSLSTLNNATISLVVIFIIGGIASLFRAWLFYLAGQKFVARMRKELFAAIVKQDIAFFDQSRTGELVNRLASDTQVLQNTVTVNISMAFRYTIQVIGCIVLLFITNWKLTIVMLGIIPILIIGAMFYGKKVKLLGKQYQDELAKSSTTGEEVIANIRTVKAFSKEEKFVNIYAKDIHGSYLIGKTLAIANGVFAGVVSIIAQLAIVLIVYVGANQVLNGTTTTGQLTTFLLYTLTVAMSFAFLSSLFTDFMTAIGASDRIFELMDRIPTIPISGGQVLNNDTIVGEIELKGINFTYPTRSTQVLKDINIRLRKGAITALVGPSGGGKSTIVSIIERFYDPESGVVELDGHDIRQLDPRWYRSLLGYVSQEPLLFAGTIKENIAFGIENATMEQIMDAAQKANAHQFINEFENKYDTVVGERGVRLSGGQKQRIAISRALLLDPKVLLLDEATSALDAESEYLVKEAIDRLMHNRTVLVIAHRLSTVVNAHTVLVVNQGKIEERGTHSELVKNENGIYYNLVRRQLTN